MRLRKKNVSRVAAVAMAAAMTVSMAAPAAVAATAVETTTDDVAVEAAADSQTIPVTVTFVDEDGNQVGNPAIVNADYYPKYHSAQFSALLLTAPEGYELAATGDVSVNNIVATAESASVNVTVRKVAPATKTVYVEYQDEATGESVDFFELTVNADDTYANTSALKVPEGYEVCNAGDFYFGQNATATVKVRKVVKTRTVYVEYQDEATKESVGFFELTVNADDTYANTSKLDKIPEGYELCETGDFYFGKNATATVKVRKIAKADDGIATKPGNGTMDPNFVMGYHPIREFFRAVFRFLFGRH